MACTNNLLVNPEFASGLTGWTFFTNGTASASVVAGQAVCTITAGGTNTQLYQDEFSLTAGITYTVEFKAKTNAAVSMQVRIIQDNAPNNLLGFSKTVSLTTTLQTFSFTFVASATEPNARIYFIFNSMSSKTITLDSVCVGASNCGYITITSGDGDIAPSFEYERGQSALQVNVSDASISDNPITHWVWSYRVSGPGAYTRFAVTQNALLTVSTGGTYDVQLQVGNVDGCATIAVTFAIPVLTNEEMASVKIRKKRQGARMGVRIGF